MQVRVPASVANLGSGFDVLALAVDLWLDVEAEPAGEPDWLFGGEGEEVLNRYPNPLSVLPMRGRVRSGIPMGVGLGSSAAARLAAATLAGLGRDDAFGRAANEERHLDNVAAAAYGGVRLLAGEHTVALPAPDAEVALLVANESTSTEEARAVLRTQVPLGDAIFNAGRLGLLVDALHSGRLEQLGAAMEDRLHQPVRQHLYPWTVEVMAAARAGGAYGASISGAGPTVFALAPRGRGSE
ncbi:MAG: homoserine kinase, partial [Candidatus Dormiibacterota bacterium]